MKRKNSAPLLTRKMRSSTGANGAAMRDLDPGNSQLSQSGSSQLSQKASQLDSTLVLQSTQQSSCYACKQSIATGLFQTTFLKCHFCENQFHGVCLDIPNKSLLDFLYVVDEIGGWTCMNCRTSLTMNNKPSKNTKAITNSNLELIHQEIKSMKTQLEIISDSVISLHSDTRTIIKPGGPGILGSLTYAQAASDGSSSQQDKNKSQKIPVTDLDDNLYANLRSQILLAGTKTERQTLVKSRSDRSS